MSTRHPIIAVTGSSGAGTTSVTVSRHSSPSRAPVYRPSSGSQKAASAPAFGASGHWWRVNSGRNRLVDRVEVTDGQ